MLGRYVQALGLVIAVERIAGVINQIAIAIFCEPEQYLSSLRQMQMVIPVIQAARAGDCVEPGSAIIVNSIGCKLITGKRVVIMGVIDLKVTDRERCAIERGCGIRV